MNSTMHRRKTVTVTPWKKIQNSDHPLFLNSIALTFITSKVKNSTTDQIFTRRVKTKLGTVRLLIKANFFSTQPLAAVSWARRSSNGHRRSCF
jgi:hypothetical protein